MDDRTASKNSMLSKEDIEKISKENTVLKRAFQQVKNEKTL
jgi:hypothetical protein